MDKLTKILNWWPKPQNIKWLSVFDKIFDVNLNTWYKNRTPKAQKELKTLMIRINSIVMLVGWYVLSCYLCNCFFEHHDEHHDLMQYHVGGFLFFLISLIVLFCIYAILYELRKYILNILTLVKEESPQSKKLNKENEND